MYIGRGTVQVSALIEVHSGTDMSYVISGDDEVQVTLGTETDACLVLTGKGTERLAETMTQAAAELRRQSSAAERLDHP